MGPHKLFKENIAKAALPFNDCINTIIYYLIDAVIDNFANQISFQSAYEYSMARNGKLCGHQFVENEQHSEV